MVRAGASVSLPTFVTEEAFDAGATVTLGEEAAHHMRVRRLDAGMPVGLLDGAGRRGTGVLTLLAKRHATVSVERVDEVSPAAAIHLLLPVADKDRMLWLAEKATELEVASWRPVLYRRSRHVSPRGEGPTFHQKVQARIAGALEQSRGAWAPMVFPEAPLAQALAAAPEGIRLVLEQGGTPIAEALASRAPDFAAARVAGGLPPAIVLAVGPEGGFEPAELDDLRGAGFAPCAVGRTILRFETAAVAGVAAARTALETVAPAAPTADQGDA